MGESKSFESTVEKLVAEMDYEFSRSGSPANFPKFPDIPTARYTSDEFYALEKEHLWNKAWVIAGREEDVAEVGSFLTFCLLYTSPSPRDATLSRMPSSA